MVGGRASNDVWALGNAALTLPPQTYTLGSGLPAGTQQRLALGFALGAGTVGVSGCGEDAEGGDGDGRPGGKAAEVRRAGVTDGHRSSCSDGGV